MRNMRDKEISIFWFKRDLRLEDNPALHEAARAGFPLVLVYIMEPSLITDPHYSERHFNFIKESISDLNKQLAAFNARILCMEGEVVDVLKELDKRADIARLYSTVETGIDKTFSRDKQVKKFCKAAKINWNEYAQNSVERGRSNRDFWRLELDDFLRAPIQEVDFSKVSFVPENDLLGMESKLKLFPLHTPAHPFQKGGRDVAIRYADSFFSDRIGLYSKTISKPERSRIGCSRLSPYIAWGNISIREVYQRGLKLKAQRQYSNQLKAFLPRLRWQSHFIQKFESEIRMEKEAINRGYIQLSQPRNDSYVEAWKTGKTGYPLVDASMRAVVLTGYLNFRMRALVTSFLTHHLFQHFTTGAAWLGSQFLDFEPGIHYSQMQMQAGLTGINTVRVYNPTTNALKHDEDAVFIKKYLPELNMLPPPLAIEPWKVTAMEEAMYGFEYGVDYPKRIVDISATRAHALEVLYGQRKDGLAKAEINRILDRHTLHKTESRFP